MIVTTVMRRKAFRAALAVSNQSQAKWCREHNIGPHHVGLVLNGKRGSRPVTREVDAFIARTLLPFMIDYTARTAA